MTKEEAVKLFETNWWEHVSQESAARFQLNEPLLCMPFSKFHAAVEKLLGRSVFTHEFVSPEALAGDAGGE